MVTQDGIKRAAPVKWFLVSYSDFNRMMNSMRFAWDYELEAGSTLYWLSDDSEAPTGDSFIKKVEGPDRTHYYVSEACQKVLNATADDLH